MLRESNVIYKKRYSLSVAIAYPSLYNVAISTLSFHMLYFKLNEYSEVYAERVVYDKPSSGNGFVSIETSKPLSKFDAIFFSVHYELDYVRLVRMLISSNIEPRRRKRRKPLIIVGGPCVTSNPYPLFKIANVIGVGEMEGIVPEVVEALIKGEKAEDELAGKRGILVPDYDGKVERYWLKDLNNAWSPTLHVLPKEGYEGIYGRAFLAEVSRGCTNMCLFCLLAYHFCPERRKDLAKLKREIERGVELNDVKSVALISSNYPSDSYGIDLLNFIVRDLGLSISIPSIRIEALNEGILELLREGGQRIVTVAPETGNEGLRFLLNKKVRDEEIFTVLKNARKLGFRAVKMYFMYGLPRERKEDLDSIVSLVKKIKKLGFNDRNSIRISINPFISKTGTPFQFADLDSYEELLLKRKYLCEKLSGDPSIRLSGYSPRDAIIQAIFSTGNEEVSDLLISWASFGTGTGNLRKTMKAYGIRNWNELYSRYAKKSPLITKSPHLERVWNDFLSKEL